ncbi:MAG: alpha/beta hydrolase-fold protein [Fusicatenibacter sp.]|nr:alpha/beta hydrolase-fold protein [Lachnospiraceae bacterium]MDY2937934.1 alpha/beta hydrolase-fold protein [Fusicatenibacter sp.]
MALVQASIFSKSLMRTVTIWAVIPSDKMDFEGKSMREEKPFKTLYLLHGIFGDHTDWVSGTRIARWAQDANLAVIMPAGENLFYLDNPNNGEKFGEFIGQELIDLTRKLFPLSRKREDTFIAGLSMGGYGAIRNGLKYHENFGAIAGLSSALILDGAVNSTENLQAPYTFRTSYYRSIFGDLDQLKGSDKDPAALVRQLKAEGAEFPAMYLCCGTDDSLLEANREFHKVLVEEGVDVTYEEGPGAHEWDFWDRYIKRVLEWLPLEDKCEGVSSGNVM